LGRNLYPDFSVQNEIAVEVTRLEKIAVVSDEQVNVTASQIGIAQKIFNDVTRFSNPEYVSSWLVSSEFRRPIETSSMRVGIKLAIERFRNANPIQDHVENVAGNLSITFHRSSCRHTTEFLDGGSSDLNDTGYSSSSLESAFTRACERKLAKALPAVGKFAKHHLLIVNTLTYGIADADSSTLQDVVNHVAFWDRVTLVNPLQIEGFWDFSPTKQA